jgi:DNA topoisomerase-2
LRAKKGQHQIAFYHEGEYERGKSALPPKEADAWTIKYFKGLGTSTATEFKEYFRHKKVVQLLSEATTNDEIDKVFNKKRSEDRKTWLESYDRAKFLDTSRDQITYDEFVNLELIHFSTYDNRRSIACAIDGLKPSQRKILYGAFCSRLFAKEQKVSEFSGYVSGNVAYHHGEASLNGAIVNMAQTFVGSNNIALLLPNGQFGTRMHGGEDSASPRYIYTQQSPITRLLFNEKDDAVLEYVQDDGKQVEPFYFVPILPFILVNGSAGIGTGFSSSIPPFHPLALVQALRCKLGVDEKQDEKDEKQDEKQLEPYYAGFRGTVEASAEPNKWIIRGSYTALGPDSLVITELPVGTWTMPYITFLESLCESTVHEKTGKRTPALLKNFVDASTDTTVSITLTFHAPVDWSTIEKTLKLSTTVNIGNMHLFDGEGRLRKYANAHQIIDEFFPIRLALYEKRKAFLLEKLDKQRRKCYNKERFILACLQGTMDLRRKSNAETEVILAKAGYDTLEGDYKYLTKLPMDSVTSENVDKMIRDRQDAEREFKELEATTIQTMWLQELEVFEAAFKAQEQEQKDQNQKDQKQDQKQEKDKKKKRKTEETVVSKKRAI